MMRLNDNVKGDQPHCVTTSLKHLWPPCAPLAAHDWTRPHDACHPQPADLDSAAVTLPYQDTAAPSVQGAAAVTTASQGAVPPPSQGAVAAMTSPSQRRAVAPPSHAAERVRCLAGTGCIPRRNSIRDEAEIEVEV